MIVDCQKHKNNVFLSTVHSQVKIQVCCKWFKNIRNESKIEVRSEDGGDVIQ